MIPSVGRIVHIRLSEDCARNANADRAACECLKGSTVNTTDAYPLLITKVWDGGEAATETTLVNGQVFLDGNDTFWVTSVQQGTKPGQWFEPPRV